MNASTIYELCQTDTSKLVLNKQRELMLRALGMIPSCAVDVAKREPTGVLKTELRVILERIISDELSRLGDDDIGPMTPEERALLDLDR